jgi:hypothetical protein
LSECVYEIGFATLEDLREHDWGQQRDTTGRQSDYILMRRFIVAAAAAEVQEYANEEHHIDESEDLAFENTMIHLEQNS